MKKNIFELIRNLIKGEKGFVDTIATNPIEGTSELIKPSKLEIPRKLFHMYGSIIGWIYLFSGMTREEALTVLAPFVLLVVGIDLIRIFVPAVNKYTMEKVGILMRKNEEKQLSTGSFYIIASFIAMFLYSKEIAIVAIFFLAFGDTFAAIIGRLIGRIKIMGKTLEGSLACFFTCFFIGLAFFSPVVAFLGALAATIAELVPLPINDNITIPVFSGFVMTLILM